MDCKSRLGSKGNSFTASGSSDFGETIGLPSSFVALSYFILAVPMRNCLGKHSCMSYTFPIVILNGTCCFRSVKAMKN